MLLDEAQRTAMRDELQSKVAMIRDLNLDEVLHSELGTYGFVQARDSFEAMKEAARLLDRASTDRLPPRVAEKAINSLANITGHIAEMRTYSPEIMSNRGQNPIQAKSQILERFSQADNQFWDDMAPALAFALSVKQAEDPTSINSVATGLVRNAMAALDRISSLEDEMKQVLGAARSAAAELGVERHAGLFAEEAKEHRDAAGNWLLATGVSAALTLIAVALNLWWVWETPARTAETPGMVQLSLAKVLGFSLLVSVTVWCGRLYRAARHNYVVNKHRQNALSSFQVFKEGSDDEQTQNAVLLHAAQCIFNQQPSGYASSDNEGGNTPSIIELVRTINGPGRN